MDEFGFDDLIREFLRETGQVSQGLNLVLRLKHPLDMPRLLLEISKCQRQLDEALEELNFVHFARFLPSPEGTALQVITEFDGDLEPYAMDFAVAIGDIFTVILEFVQDAPPLPVREHPDEFWDFVKRNNRVRVAGVPMPEESYYPLFSAYRTKTVLDVVGPRGRLPAPALDRPWAEIDLADVQGNLLDNYHARFARHFILSVTDAARARSWIAGLAGGQAGSNPVGGVPQVTTAGRGAEELKTMLNVGLTHAGMLALGLEPALLAAFPQAFREGPSSERRASANGDIGDSAPGNWIFGAPGGDEHVMLSLHAPKCCKTYLDEASQAIRNVLADRHSCGLAIRSEHYAAALPQAREHFGYRDGIAQPRLANWNDGRNDLQPATSPGEYLLGENYKDIFGGPSIGKLPPQLARNGTFCAVRVLAQHVEAFEKLLDAGAAQLRVSRELVAAKLVGRWFDGQPLAQYPDEAARNSAPEEAAQSNAFDYAPSHEYPDTLDDSLGLRCPAGAHIRRVNPRTSRTAGVRYSRRLIRRGMTYDWPDEKGIFGLFYCGSLERQFEFIQQQWMNGDLFTSGVRGTQDPIGGAQTLSGTFLLPGMGAGGGPAVLKVPRLTTTRASLYLFMPGIAALKALESPALVARRAMQAGAWTAGRTEARPLSAAKIARRLHEDIFGPRRPIAPAEPARELQPAPAPASGHPTTSFDPDRFDPKDPAFISNPFPAFASFRRCRPVHYVPKHEAFWVFSHDLVTLLCTDGVSFLKQSPASLRPRGLFSMDPPRHTQVRKILEQAFRGAIENAPWIAQRAVDRALRDITGPSFDLVEQFARRVPREVFFEIVGIPAARQAEVDSLARTLMMHADRTLDSLQRLYSRKAGLSLSWLLFRMMPEALLSGERGSLLYEVARQTSPVPGARLNPGESTATLLQFVLGGYMSTEFLLATGTRNLLLDERRPWTLLQQDLEQRLPPALEEMRRYDTPLGVIDRYAASDISFGGCDVPFGARLMGMLGSANRDEKAFGPDADRFDITRTPAKRNLAMGWGIHECIGKPLQEIVATAALRELVRRFPDLRLASPAQPPWFTDPYFRSFSRLTVCT